MGCREQILEFERQVPTGDEPDAIGALEAEKARLQQRLANGHAPPQKPQDELLTPEEVAEWLKVSLSWVYDHQKAFGAHHLSSKCLRFSRKAVGRYLARR